MFRKTEVINVVKKKPKPKYCFDCDDKREILTGSQIFYICNKTGLYRTPNDQCNLPAEKKGGET